MAPRLTGDPRDAPNRSPPRGRGVRVEDGPGGRTIRFRGVHVGLAAGLWAIALGSAAAAAAVWADPPAGPGGRFTVWFLAAFAALWGLGAAAVTREATRVTTVRVAGRRVTVRRPDGRTEEAPVPPGGEARVRASWDQEDRGFALDVGRGAGTVAVAEDWPESAARWLAEVVNAALADPPTGEPPAVVEAEPAGPPAGIRLRDCGPPLRLAFPSDPDHGRSLRTFFLLWCGMVPLVGGAAAWFGAFDGAGRDPIPTVGLLIVGANLLFGPGGVWLGNRLRHVSHEVTAAPDRVTVETDGVLGPARAGLTPRPGCRAACVACGRHDERLLWRVEVRNPGGGAPLTFATGFDRAPREWAAEAITAALASPPEPPPDDA